MISEPYQLRAAEWITSKRRGMVESPAGSGKTHCMALALDLVIRKKQRTEKVRIGALCNTSDQAMQIWTAFDRFESIRAQDVKIRCAAANTDWSDRNVLIIDECHHSLAPSWNKQIKSCPGAWWFFTATSGMDGDKDAAKALLDLAGNNFFRVERKEVANRLVTARVILMNAFDDGLGPQIDDMIEDKIKKRKKFSRLPEWKIRQVVSWQVVSEFGIIKNKLRNACAVSLANHHHNNHGLMLVNEVEHGKSLVEQIPGAVMCYAAMGRGPRIRTIADFAAGKINWLVATSLADEGLDIPIADILLYVSGGQSEIKATQRTGRVLRTFANKTHALIYDYTDSACKLMAKHSAKRQAVYRQLGYEMEGELALNLV